jgi:pimeloyl-ACP methyl ester carboxylesterase
MWLSGLTSAMRARANGLELEYDTFGSPRNAPLVLIMGFAQQLIGWDEAFCEQLARRDFFVVRFDNRDIGLSTKLEGAPLPDIAAILGGDMSTRAYSMEDMADDTAGLLDALGFVTAHVVGASMGGMIAQTLSLRHPRRVLTLTSIMSSTGDPSVGHSTPGARAMLIERPPAARDAFIEYGVRLRNTLKSPGFPFDEARARERSARTYDRSFYPPGGARQFAAIASQPDRTKELKQLRVPTLVVHGTDDPLINISGGEATARAIPEARFLTVPGMGHELPEGAWTLVVDAIADNTARIR